MVREQKVRADGYSVFWVISAPMNRAKLMEGYKALGLEDHCPNERTDYDSLSDAYKEMYPGKDYDIVPRANRQRDGVEVIHIKRGGNGQANGYELTVACRVVDQKVEVIEGQTDLPRLQELYAAAKAIVTPNSVGSSIVAVVGHAKGTALRPTGGFYWVPEDALAMFKGVEAVLTTAVAGEGRTDIYAMSLQMTVDTARAVRDGLMAEILAETRKIADEIDSGECGEQALANRKARAMALEAKVSEYEKILGEALPTLTAACEEAQKLAFAAMMKVQQPTAA